jgi:hypothetical protein
MKVTGPGSSGRIGASAGSKPAAGGDFAPAGPGGAAEASASTQVGGAAGLGSLGALMALQGAPEPMERRRRAVRRAGRLLDVLDEVKLSMLEGAGSAHALERLRTAVRESRDGTEDPGLEGVLDEIETRAAVELAKQEMARAAA